MGAAGEISRNAKGRCGSRGRHRRDVPCHQTAEQAVRRPASLASLTTMILSRIRDRHGEAGQRCAGCDHRGGDVPAVEVRSTVGPRAGPSGTGGHERGSLGVSRRRPSGPTMIDQIPRPVIVRTATRRGALAVDPLGIEQEGYPKILGSTRRPGEVHQGGDIGKPSPTGLLHRFPRRRPPPCATPLDRHAALHRQRRCVQPTTARSTSTPTSVMSRRLARSRSPLARAWMTMMRRAGAGSVTTSTTAQSIEAPPDPLTEVIVEHGARPDHRRGRWPHRFEADALAKRDAPRLRRG